MSKMEQLIKEFNLGGNKSLIKEVAIEISIVNSLWFLEFPKTKNFYMGREHETLTCYLFSEKSYCKDACHFFRENGADVSMVEVLEEDRLRVFNDLLRSGFETVTINNGKDSLTIDLFSIIQKPNPFRTKEEKAPITNPKIVSTFNLISQGQNIDDLLPNLVTDLSDNIMAATYIVPIFREDNSIKMAVLRGENANEFFIPFFTDIVEFAKFDTNWDFDGYQASFKDIQAIVSNGDSVVLNPFGVNLILGEEVVKNIENGFLQDMLKLS